MRCRGEPGVKAKVVATAYFIEVGIGGDQTEIVVIGMARVCLPCSGPPRSLIADAKKIDMRRFYVGEGEQRHRHPFQRIGKVRAPRSRLKDIARNPIVGRVGSECARPELVRLVVFLL
jgi:hypothetical protein